MRVGPLAVKMSRPGDRRYWLWHWGSRRPQERRAPDLGLLGLRGGPSRRASRLAEVRAYIERHLADPALHPGRIAADLRMSTRYLYGLFADGGETPMQWVIRRRLEHCRSDLARDVAQQRDHRDRVRVGVRGSLALRPSVQGRVRRDPTRLAP